MKKTTALCSLAILAAASGPGAGAAFAQIGFLHSSIEWLTASSDVVVRASVADLAYKDSVAEGVGHQWVAVTLKVGATLKGKAPETIVFVIKQYGGNDKFSRWKKSGQAVLWFLVESSSRREEIPRDFPAQPPGKLRLREDFSEAAVELGSPKTGKRVPRPILSMDFRVLDEEDKILEAIKAEVCRKHKGEIRGIHFLIPRELAGRTGKSGDGDDLYVPVNDHLEQLARTWVRSKEAWILRAGVKALGQFESEEDAAILKKVLGD